MKHCRVIAGFSGITGAFFSLYILFAGPVGVNLRYQAFATLLLVSGGSMLLMTEKSRPTYYAAGTYLATLVVMVIQFSEIPSHTIQSVDPISSLIYFMFIASSLTAFILSIVSIFDKEYGRISMKRIV